MGLGGPGAGAGLLLGRVGCLGSWCRVRAGAGPLVDGAGFPHSWLFSLEKGGGGWIKSQPL